MAPPGFTVAPDLAASDRYWPEDITEPFVLDRTGCLDVPTGPGLGVTIRHDVIRKYEIWRDRVALSS